MVIIKVDTGFSGATHQLDTGLTVKEWEALGDKFKNEYLNDAVAERIEAYAVDEDTNKILS